MSVVLSYRVAPGGRLRGRIAVPGDKSISHRVALLGAIARGVSEASGFLEGADTLATLAACRCLGVEIDGPRSGRLRIAGVGKHGLRAPAEPLDLGNSGTALRLLTGLLAGQRFETRLVGDASLSARPMERVAQPLRDMGADVRTSERGTPPVHILPSARTLQGIDYAMPIASAQVKSCLLLAGLYAGGTTRVTEPAVTRDHSERMLKAFGAGVTRTGSTVAIDGASRLEATTLRVPGDISSAAFFIVGAAIAPGSDLVLEGVGVNPTRTGVIDILRRMGAHIEVLAEDSAGEEPVADLRVRASELEGIDIPGDLVPLAIDEFPAIFVAAACARGTTRLRGAAELRVKESDRIAVMAGGLTRLGVAVEETADGLTIEGGAIRGGRVQAHADHRVAMAFAMAGLACAEPITVADCTHVETSFPGFPALAAKSGLGIEVARGPG